MKSLIWYNIEQLMYNVHAHIYCRNDFNIHNFMIYEFYNDSMTFFFFFSWPLENLFILRKRPDATDMAPVANPW